MSASSSPILRLRGLPFSASAEEVGSEGFFAGYDCVAVHLCTRNGKRTGEAYIELSSAEEAARALKERQHEHLGSRYIEIFVAVEADLLAQTSGGGGAPSLLGHVVRLRGLPFNSTAADVLAFFEGVDVVGGEPGVVFTCTPDGRPTGEAYVALADAEALAAALGRHKEKIGARYIEIFESSKGDMFQAVQQHGYFTTLGGRRRHHWHQQHGALPAAAAGQAYPADAGGGGRGMEEMTQAFAGFGLSQRDMQVPGPPRWGAYGAPADQQYQQYMAGAGRTMTPAVGVMPMRWRPSGQLQPVGMQQRGSGMQHFNPAPGPPPGKGGRAPNGTARSGGSMMGMPHEYGGGGHGHGQPMMFNPFMMQHPLMMPQQHHHHTSPWAASGMMQQQGGGWYGGMGMARAGMHGAQMAGMSGHTYGFSHAGFYPIRTTGGMTQMSGHQQQSHGGGRQQQQQQQQQSAGAGGSSASQAAAAPAASQAGAAASAADASSGSGGVQEPQQQADAAAEGSAEETSSAAERPGSAAEAAEAPAAPPAAEPPTPEQ